MTNVTVLCGRRRRRWTTIENLRLVAESLSAGLRAAEFARCHDVHPNLLERSPAHQTDAQKITSGRHGLTYTAVSGGITRGSQREKYSG